MAFISVKFACKTCLLSGKFGTFITRSLLHLQLFLMLWFQLHFNAGDGIGILSAKSGAVSRTSASAEQIDQSRDENSEIEHNAAGAC